MGDVALVVPGRVVVPSDLHGGVEVHQRLDITVGEFGVRGVSLRMTSASVVDSRRVRSNVICSLRDPQTAELLAVARQLLTRKLRQEQGLLAALDDGTDAVSLAAAARRP